MKRAAFNLGLTPAEARDQLRELKPGFFLAYGPAFHHNDPQLMLTGDVATTHPKAGARKTEAPKPTAAIIAMLPKLADLPKEVEKKAATEADLRRELAERSREIAEVRRELTQVRKAVPPAPDPQVIKRAAADGYQHGLEAALRGMRREVAQQLRASAEHLDTALNTFSAQMIKAHADLAPPAAVKAAMVAQKAAPTQPKATERPPREDAQGDLPKGEAAVLAACLQYPDGVTREQLGGLVGLKRSTRNLYLQSLMRRQIVTDAGRGAVKAAEVLF